MQVVIKKTFKVNVWSLFCEEPDDDDGPPDLPLDLDAIANALDNTLNTALVEQGLKQYDSVQVYLPEGGSNLMLRWSPRGCEQCEEAAQDSYAWCSDHTFWAENGSAADIRKLAETRNVPDFIVDTFDKLNDGTLTIG